MVISGDTTYDERMVEAAKGADILVHEVYSEAGLKARSAAWQAYHAAYHTSAPDLARLASRIQPRVLVLYHQLAMGGPREQILKELKAGYSGTVVDGKDLDVIR